MQNEKDMDYSNARSFIGSIGRMDKAVYLSVHGAPVQWGASPDLSGYCGDDPFSSECYKCNRFLRIAGSTTGNRGTFFIRLKPFAPRRAVLNESAVFEFEENATEFNLFEIFPAARFSVGLFEVVVNSENKEAPGVLLVITNPEETVRFGFPTIKRK